MTFRSRDGILSPMSLFSDPFDAAFALRQDRLLLASGALGNADSLSDEYLYSQLLAAEADIERALRVFLEPVEILPEGATQAERDAFDGADTRWVEEPGYDLEPDFFSGEAWGFIVTRHRPLIAVHSIKFVYPQPFTSVFQIPADWIRLDRKYGHIRLVPGTQSFAAPLSVWVMRVMGGGRTIPHMIQVRYRAGLANAARDYPDILDLVYKSAVLRILEDAFLPQSGSISADGLSQSQSWDTAKYRDLIDRRLDRLREAIGGIRCLAL